MNWFLKKYLTLEKAVSKIFPQHYLEGEATGLLYFFISVGYTSQTIRVFATIIIAFFTISILTFIYFVSFVKRDLYQILGWWLFLSEFLFVIKFKY